MRSPAASPLAAALVGLLPLRAPLRRVAVVPVSGEPGAAPVAPTPENVSAGRYPLSGCVYLYLARAGRAEPLSPEEAALARYLWSDEGQGILADAGYAPLSATSIERARAWLAAADERVLPAPPRCRSEALGRAQSR